MPEPEHVSIDDTVNVTVCVQIPHDLDEAARQEAAVAVARQYSAALWEMTPVAGRVESVDATLPDWQPTPRVYDMPRRTLAVTPQMTLDVSPDMCTEQIAEVFEQELRKRRNAN